MVAEYRAVPYCAIISESHEVAPLPDQYALSELLLEFQKSVEGVPSFIERLASAFSSRCDAAACARVLGT